MIFCVCSVCSVGTELRLSSRQLQYMSTPSRLLKAAYAGEAGSLRELPVSPLPILNTCTHEHTHKLIFCVHTTGFFVCRLLSIPRWGGGGVSRGTCESFYLSFIYHTHEVSKLMDDCQISQASGFAVVKVKYACKYFDDMLQMSSLIRTKSMSHDRHDKFMMSKVNQRGTSLCLCCVAFTK